MAIRRYLYQKQRSNSTPTPATGMFQPRPFAQTPKLESPTTPDLQTKVEGQNSDRLSRIEISQPSLIQPKLAIGAPDDKYEQEADTIARQVVNQINAPTSPEPNGDAETVQRQPFSQSSSATVSAHPQEAVGGKSGASNFVRQERSAHSSESGPVIVSRKLTSVVPDNTTPVVQCKLTPDQIKHANRIRKARGLPLLPVEDVQQFNNVEEAIGLNSAPAPEAANPEAANPQAANPQAAAPKSDAKRQGSKFHAGQDYSWIQTTLEEFKSWDKIKAQFGNDTPTMWQFFDFRQWYVDGLINVLRDTYPGLIAKSVGSQDLTSDYDITISTPDSGNDVEAIKWFNTRVRTEFGVEPGTLFDTNLYAKDYLKVQENIDDSAKAEQNPDTDLAQPGGGFGGMGHLSQDVAALVKQRRYMKQVEWDSYVESVVQSIADPQQQYLIRHQYEEADSVYQMFAYELLGEVEKEVNPQKVEHIKNHTSLSKEEEEVLKKEPNKAVREILHQQLLNPDRLQEIAHDDSDLVLKKSNELYLERMKKVRQIQATIQELGNGSPEKVEALKAQVKQLLGEACFFAAEAYHSEGAVKHIVAGVQGAKDPNKKAEIMNSLSPEHFLQSFNEQLGDFLKDLGHYAGQDPGKIFYRSSKYLYRLFLAVAELREYKLPDLENLSIEQQHGAASAIATTIDEKLVAIRKGKKPKENASDTDKNEAAITAMQEILNVGSANELKGKILKMAQEFNSKVRSQAKELAAPARNTSKAYFQNRSQ